LEYWKKAAIINGLGGYSDTMDLWISTMTLPLIGQTFGWGVALIGYVSGLTRIGTIIHALVSGPMIDYFGRKWVWTLGNFGVGIICILLATVATTPEMWIGIGLFRLWWTWMTGSAGIFIQEEAPPEKRAWVYGLSRILSVFGSLTVTVGITVTSILGVGWRPLWIFNGIQNFVIAAISAVFLRESSVWLQRRKLIEEGKIPKTERLPLRKLWSPELRKKFLIACWIWFFTAFARAPHWFQTTYMIYQLKIDAATVGNILTIATIVSAFGFVYFGRLADTRGRLKAIGYAASIGTVFLILWLLTDKIVGAGTLLTLVFLTVTFTVWTVLFQAYMVPLSTWLAEIFPTSVRASAQTISYLLYSIEIVLSTYIGMLGEVIGIGLATLLVGGAGWILSVLGPLLSRIETKGTKITAD
jgi:MFS family permease